MHSSFGWKGGLISGRVYDHNGVDGGRSGSNDDSINVRVERSSMETPKATFIDGSKVKIPTVKEKVENIEDHIQRYWVGLMTGSELSVILVDEAVKLGFSAKLEKTDWEKGAGKDEVWM